ncbi:MAG: tetratricopeptide repeat protein [Odoribacteraceae bacterium]|jgi:tetratricopeptide (TPR) repeat protein|nr:tetratricopeptide repeat protein [Odoribacteraceae bacterium]
MKKILLVLFLFTLHAGNLLAIDTRAIEAEATRAYQEGNHARAAELYNEILATGVESVALYYNLGNCYYKQNEIARAILNYERALLVDPRDEDVIYNLEMARRATVDKINVLPLFFLVEWYNAVVTALTADQWGYLSVILFLCFLGMIVLFFHATTVALRKGGFVIGLVALLLALSSTWFAAKQYRRETVRDQVIVMTPSVVVRGSPDPSGTELYVVHEGLKITVIDSLNSPGGQWYNVRLADGNVGWVPRADVENI